MEVDEAVADEEHARGLAGDGAVGLACIRAPIERSVDRIGVAARVGQPRVPRDGGVAGIGACVEGCVVVARGEQDEDQQDGEGPSILHGDDR